jgi:hypothetical protein
MSIRSEILQALAARLRGITTAHGYSLDVQQVYADEVPLGMDLAEHEVPAILLLDKECKVEHEFTDLNCEWIFELQLIHGQVSDSVMLDFTRQVAKALYADSPTAENNNGLRTLHNRVYDLQLLGAFGDLNTIDGNRFAILELVVFFRTKPWDL